MKKLFVSFLLIVSMAFISNSQGIYSTYTNRVDAYEDARDSVNTKRLWQLVYKEVQGLPKPGWYEHYAYTIVKMVKNFEANGMISHHYVHWDSVVTQMLQSFQASQGLTRPYLPLIIDDPEANIMATEGGLVVITVGLLAEIKNYEELRMLLAHELGHLHYNHTYMSYVRQRQQENMDKAAATVLAVAGGLAFGTFFAAGYGFSIWYLTSRNNTYKKLTSFLLSEETHADEQMMRIMKSDGREFAGNYPIL